MEIKSFIELLEPEFEDVPTGTIQPETEFRQLDGWSSMQALIVLSRINKSYKITISAQELAQAKTMNHLFQLTVSKLQPQT